MRNACQNASVNVNCKLNALWLRVCVWFSVASGHLHRYVYVCFGLAGAKAVEREAKRFTFIPVLMLFLARIFEQTHQINAIPGLISLNGIDILKALRVNDNGRLGHQCINACACVCHHHHYRHLLSANVHTRNCTVWFSVQLLFAAHSIPMLMVGFDSKVWWNWDLQLTKTCNQTIRQKLLTADIENLHDDHWSLKWSSGRKKNKNKYQVSRIVRDCRYIICMAKVR